LVHAKSLFPNAAITKEPVQQDCLHQIAKQASQSDFQQAKYKKVLQSIVKENKETQRRLTKQTGMKEHREQMQANLPCSLDHKNRLLCLKPADFPKKNIFLILTGI
jgi:flagellar biosynthesis/type III secretory pathway protein FliH